MLALNCSVAVLCVYFFMLVVVSSNRLVLSAYSAAECIARIQGHAAVALLARLLYFFIAYVLLIKNVK